MSRDKSINARKHPWSNTSGLFGFERLKAIGPTGRNLLVFRLAELQAAKKTRQLSISELEEIRGLVPVIARIRSL